MFASLYLAVDVSDDDVALAEVASQCGYDFSHPLVTDVDAPQVAQWHGEDCLVLRLTLAHELSATGLDKVLHEGAVRLSHPSVAVVSMLGIQDAA